MKFNFNYSKKNIFLKSLLKLQKNEKSGKLEPKAKKSLTDRFNCCDKITEVSYLEVEATNQGIVSIYNNYIFKKFGKFLSYLNKVFTNVLLFN